MVIPVFAMNTGFKPVFDKYEGVGSVKGTDKR
jgi:hypothetical protein